MEVTQALPWAKRVGVAKSADGSTRLEVRCGGLELGVAGISALCAWVEKRLPRGAPPKAWVDLRGVAAGDDGVARLAACLQMVGTKAERLWLSSNGLTPGVVPHLFEMVASPTLREIHLTQNRLDDEAVLGLLCVAAGKRNLQQEPLWVLLDGNAIRDPPTVLERLRRAGVAASLASFGADQEKNSAVHLMLPNFCNQPLAPGGAHAQAQEEKRQQAKQQPWHQRLVEAASALTNALGGVAAAEVTLAAEAKGLADACCADDDEDELEFVEADSEPEAEESTTAPWDPYLDDASVNEEPQAIPPVFSEPHTAAVAPLSDSFYERRSLLGTDVANALSRLRQMLSRPNPEDTDLPAAATPPDAATRVFLTSPRSSNNHDEIVAKAQLPRNAAGSWPWLNPKLEEPVPQSTPVSDALAVTLPKAVPVTELPPLQALTSLEVPARIPPLPSPRPVTPKLESATAETETQQVSPQRVPLPLPIIPHAPADEAAAGPPAWLQTQPPLPLPTQHSAPMPSEQDVAMGAAFVNSAWQDPPSSGGPVVPGSLPWPAPSSPLDATIFSKARPPFPPPPPSLVAAIPPLQFAAPDLNALPTMGLGSSPAESTAPALAFAGPLPHGTLPALPGLCFGAAPPDWLGMLGTAMPVSHVSAAPLLMKQPPLASLNLIPHSPPPTAPLASSLALSRPVTASANGTSGSASGQLDGSGKTKKLAEYEALLLGTAFEPVETGLPCKRRLDDDKDDAPWHSMRRRFRSDSAPGNGDAIGTSNSVDL